MEELLGLFEPLSFISKMRARLLQWESDTIMISQGQRVEEGEQRGQVSSRSTQSPALWHLLCTSH